MMHISINITMQNIRLTNGTIQIIVICIYKSLVTVTIVAATHCGRQRPLVWLHHIKAKGDMVESKCGPERMEARRMCRLEGP